MHEEEEADDQAREYASATGSSRRLTARWVGWQDARSLAELLARRLGDGHRLSRARFRLKLLTTPHIAVGDVAVVGLEPQHRLARCVGAVLTLAASAARPVALPVDIERLPLGLRCRPREWRVVNMAASDVGRVPGAALSLGLLVVSLAEAHGAVLRAAARIDDDRLVPAYIAHGFTPDVRARNASGVVHMVRPPSQLVNVARGGKSAPEHYALADAHRDATRRHYEAYPFVEGGDRRVRHWIRRLAPLLPDDLVRDRQVLDLGCGSGEVALGLRSRGALPVAIDLTAAATTRVRQRVPDVPVCQADALALPFADASFDHVVSIGVLHHTPDWRRGLAEAARVVRPGGRVVILLYRRWTWYHLLWTLVGPIRTEVPVTTLERLPQWFLMVMRLIVAAQVGQRYSDTQLRRLLADQVWTPVATFVTRREVDMKARAVDLAPVRYVPLFLHAHLVAYERLSG